MIFYSVQGEELTPLKNKVNKYGTSTRKSLMKSKAICKHSFLFCSNQFFDWEENKKNKFHKNFMYDMFSSVNREDYKNNESAGQNIS